ncbi:hypothetical protein [Halomonas ramblicola]|uniref:hypothetical protein n=1 Tax=Halomonas ramblicola TaxID=747349 RepID=UPI0025B5812D|nr:hypothetical protein [Halomonas ramblicola]MDN3522756.1 hypothetical protein [Halomonas ramblicola]
MPDTASPDPAVTRPPLLRLLILVTLAAVAVALWYLTSYSLRGAEEVRWFPASPGCDLHHGPCRAELGEAGHLSLDLGADGQVGALEILPLEVSLEGVEATSVRVDLVGRGMDMGLHRYPLARDADGVFRGAGQVPICTQAVMPWRARVIVETRDAKLGSGFDFDVEREAP